jgi:hypothetical protein
MKSEIIWNDITKIEPSVCSEKDIFIVVNGKGDEDYIVIAECCGSEERIYFETCAGWIYTKDDITAWAEMPDVPDFREVQAE